MPPEVQPETPAVETPSAPETPPAAPSAEQREANILMDFVKNAEQSIETAVRQGADVLKDVSRETPPEPPAKKAAAKKEPTKEEPSTEPEASAKPVSEGWAAVTKREKQLRESREALKRDREQIAADKAALEKARAEVAGLRELAKVDPFKAVESLGLSFDGLVQTALKGGVPTPAPAKPAEDPEKAALLKRLEQLEQRDQRREIQNNIMAFQNNCATALKQPEFELLAARPDAVEQMMDFANKFASEHGKLLTPSEIAGILQDTWREELATMGSSAAIRKALGLPVDSSAANDTSATEENEPAKPKKAGPKISNKLPSKPPPAPGKTKPTGVQSEEDILNEAAALVPHDAWDRIG